MFRVALAAAVVCVSAVSPARSAHPVYARHAMVVAAEPLATGIGLNVLRNGGNAIDAAVAVGFALAVTHPSAGNIGGGGFLLARFADGRSTFIDFRERAPERASRDMYARAEGDSRTGYRAAGVPGTVKGLEAAWKKYGHAQWAELLAPAAELASRGFTVSHGLAESLRGSRELLERFPESKRIFLRAGSYYSDGDKLIQPELARTLARIRSEGAKDFYQGETARLLTADAAAHGGLISLTDLARYEVAERRPLQGAYKGYSILTAPPPSSGGIGILQMLAVLEGSGYERSGAGSAASIHFVAEAMRRYFADRSEYLGDPDFVKIPVSGLLQKSYIAALRASIDPMKASPSEQVRPGKPALSEGTDTTHFSIVDADGTAVAVTYTLNGGYGSGVTVSGAGFLLNNEMDDFSANPGKPNMFGLIQGEANSVQPRKRPLSSMTPTIVLREGRPYMVLGTPGGPTIINSVLQVFVNVVDFGMNIQDAVNWPRFHHQWLPDHLVMERGFSPDTLELLRSRGHHISPVESIGDVAAIRCEGEWLEGAADPRTASAAQGY
jgi:gamma-glutamyltranspeptidase/glutathione hydrolase